MNAFEYFISVIDDYHIEDSTHYNIEELEICSEDVNDILLCHNEFYYETTINTNLTENVVISCFLINLNSYEFSYYYEGSSKDYRVSMLLKKTIKIPKDYIDFFKLRYLI